MVAEAVERQRLPPLAVSIPALAPEVSNFAKKNFHILKVLKKRIGVVFRNTDFLTKRCLVMIGLEAQEQPPPNPTTSQFQRLLNLKYSSEQNRNLNFDFP